MLKFKALSLLAFSLVISGVVQAAQPPETAAITKNLESKLPNLKVKAIDTTPVKGLYQLETEHGELLLVSPDGQYIVAGDLHKVGDGGVENLTEKRRSEQRVGALKELKDKDLVVFKAEGQEKGEVVVFTDTTCGYCRKFHTEIPQLNKMGITVKYAAWPRSGLQSPAGQSMAGIWCSKDRAAAMTKAKTTNEEITTPAGQACDQNVIQDQINLGQQMGVQGTPAVFTKDGRQVGGYVPAAQLAAQLGIQ
ncbi:MAG TPA: DsbC family protein [Dongiaceae bacterium]|nr:DsbC family protein [Dongiaceae bacterium]